VTFTSGSNPGVRRAALSVHAELLCDGHELGELGHARPEERFRRGRLSTITAGTRGARQSGNPDNPLALCGPACAAIAPSTGRIPPNAVWSALWPSTPNIRAWTYQLRADRVHELCRTEDALGPALSFNTPAPRDRRWSAAPSLRELWALPGPPSPRRLVAAMAEGKKEAWICERTGQRSSQEINGCRRAARTAAELGLGSLQPLDGLLPEMRQPDE